MFYRTRAILILAICCGCAPMGIGQTRGIESRSASFANHSEDPVPGLDEGSIAAITLLAGPPEGVSFVIWSDASGNSHGGGSATGAYHEAELRTDDDRVVTIAAETSDGVTGTVTVDGATHDIAQGALFLISTQNGATTVRQIDYDVTDFPTDHEELGKIADEHTEIGGFFRNAVESELEASEQTEDSDELPTSAE